MSGSFFNCSRFFPVTLVALALAASGCGGGGDDDAADASNDSAQATTADPGKSGNGQKEVAKPKAKQEESKKKKAEPVKENENAAPLTPERRSDLLDKGLEQASPKRRALALKKLLAPAFEVMGLKGARATLSEDRRTLTVIVPESSVCSADRTDEDFLKKAVQDVMPFVETVVARVSGGESLSAYAARCPRATPPAGKGRVVYEKRGTGYFETPPVRIRSKRWVVEWAQTGGFFSIFVTKGKTVDRNTVGSERGSGRKRYTGPGTFKLTITGSAEWTVRVREQ